MCLDLICQRTNVSSTYLSQMSGFIGVVTRASCSSNFMYILATTDEMGVPLLYRRFVGRIHLHTRSMLS